MFIVTFLCIATYNIILALPKPKSKQAYFLKKGIVDVKFTTLIIKKISNPKPDRVFTTTSLH